MLSKIILPDGSAITSGDQNNAIISATVTQCVNSTQELTFGSVCCQMLEAELFIAQPFSMQAGTQIQFWRGDRLVGTFLTEKPAFPSANRCRLTAFDPICKLDQDLTQWFSALIHWPYNLYDLAWMVCAQCGLELESTTILNGELPVEAFTASQVTGRQLLGMIAEAAGSFCRATPEGKVEFAWYQSASLVAGAADAILAFPQEYNTAIAEDLPGGLLLSPVTQVPAGTSSLMLTQYGQNLANLYGYSAQPIISPVGTRYSGNSLGTSISSVGPVQTLQFIQAKIAIPKDPYNSANGQIFLGFTHPAAQGQTVTVSFDLNLTGNPMRVTQLYLCANGTTSGSYFPSTTGRQWVTLPWKNDGAKSYVEIRLAGCSGTISNVQMEFGSKQSPYVNPQIRRQTVTLPDTLGGTMDWYTGIFTDARNQQHHLQGKSLSSWKGTNAFCANAGKTTVTYRQAGCFQGGMQQAAYVTAPIDALCIRQTAQDVGLTYPESGENVYILEGNPLLASMDLSAVAPTLYNRVKELCYTPCTLKIPADASVQAGDILRVYRQTGAYFTTYIMKRVETAHTQTLTATGEACRNGAAASANARYDNLQGKVLQIGRSVEGLTVENRQGQQQLAALSLTVDGISTQVQQQTHNLQQQLQKLTQFQQTADALTVSVQSIRENGSEKVTTRAGYRFDDTGLHITGSGSDLENAITEKGMYVIRDENTVMLQADAQGVIARDVTVGNYLIIGQYARLEDYADGRTACYFTGG